MSARQPWMSRLAAAMCAGLLALPAAQAVPTLSLSASPSTALVGAPLLVSILATDVTDLYGWQFSLSYNPAVLQLSSVTEGPFLATGGITTFGSGTINNTTGKVGFVLDVLQGTVPGVSGNGVLATLAFSVPQAGTSALTFSDVLFLNSALNTIAAQVQNGTVLAVVPEPAAALLFGLGLAGVALRRRLHATA